MQNRFLINPDAEFIPDMGLDKYLIGYSTGRSTYNKKMLYWLFLVGPGFFVVLIYSLIYHLKKTKERRYLIYKGGFILQYISKRGVAEEQRVVDFRNVAGISLAETDEYVYANALGRYSGTMLWLSVMGKDGRAMFRDTTVFRNLYREPERYNFKAYSFLAIAEAWRKVALRHYNEELQTKGYATFYSLNNVIEIGDHYLKVNNQVLPDNFLYHVDNGVLFLKYQTWEADRPVVKNLMVSVNYMSDKQLFYKAFQDFFNAKDWKLTEVRETTYENQMRFMPIPHRPLRRFW